MRMRIFAVFLFLFLFTLFFGTLSYIWLLWNTYWSRVEKLAVDHHYLSRKGQQVRNNVQSISKVFCCIKRFYRFCYDLNIKSLFQFEIGRKPTKLKKSIEITSNDRNRGVKKTKEKNNHTISKKRQLINQKKNV